jgi:transcriptional regulator CtsR
MTIKEKFMNEMMENQFKNMSAEDKNKMMEAMMDKFFSSMSDEEKRDMMSGMMGKMMGNNPMMGMMSMMMGKRGQHAEKSAEKMPWEICCDMMTGIKETANTAKFATTELRGLFDEWCQQIEKEMLDFIKEKGTIKVDELAEKFSLSEESVKYLLSRLAAKNMIDYKA